MSLAVDTRTKPTLVGERVLLRPIGPADAADMHAAACDPEGRRLTGTQATFTLEQVKSWCERVVSAEGRVDLAVTNKATGEFLGEVVLNEIDSYNLCANFRIGLAGERHFGKGYGSEAAALMIDYGFTRLGLNRISLEVFAFNPRAIHVYRKLGFREEGRLREVLLMDGRYHDAIVMGMLRREYLG